MKTVLSLAFAALLLASCEKKDYTCNCYDRANVGGDVRFNLSETTQRKAVKECRDKESTIDQGNTSYTCIVQ